MIMKKENNKTCSYNIFFYKKRVILGYLYYVVVAINHVLSVFYIKYFVSRNPFA